MIQSIEEKLPGFHFYAVLFKSGGVLSFKEKINSSQQLLLRFALGNIAEELLEEFGVCESIVTEENEIVAVGQYESNVLPDELPTACRLPNIGSNPC